MILAMLAKRAAAQGYVTLNSNSRLQYVPSVQTHTMLEGFYFIFYFFNLSIRQYILRTHSTLKGYIFPKYGF